LEDRPLRQVAEALGERAGRPRCSWRGVRFPAHNLDLSTPSGRLMFQIIGAMSEFERALIQERVIAGLRNATTQYQGTPLAYPCSGTGCSCTGGIQYAAEPKAPDSLDTYAGTGSTVASQTKGAPSLPGGTLRRHTSEIRTGCANKRPSGSVRGVPGPYSIHRTMLPTCLRLG